MTGEENQKREIKGWGKISNLMKLYTPLEEGLAGMFGSLARP